MRIMIVGAGGVGGFLAAYLARRADVNLTIIARGGHLAAIREKGLTLKDADGTFTVCPALATDDPAAAGIQDAVLLCTKSYGLLEAAKAAIPAIGPNTLVIPLLNGVDAAEQIAPILPPCLLSEGCIYVFSKIIAPGVIERTGSFGRLLMGSAFPEAKVGLETIAKMLREEGFPAEVPADIRREMWIKWSFICGNAQATAYYDYTVGQMREDPEAMDFLGGLVDELLAVGMAEGVNLPPDLREQVFANVAGQPYEARSSLARDIDVPGGPTELSRFAGTLCRMAKKHGIPVPCNEKVLDRFGDRL